MEWLLGGLAGALSMALVVMVRTPLSASLHRLADENEILRQELAQLKEEAVMALSRALEASDAATYHHSKRVMALSLELARSMGVSDTDLECLRVAGLLHDIGKIGLSPTVLHKPGSLSPGEIHHIRLHPIIGRRIVQPLRLLEREAELIRSHHERFDGQGYPDGLAGDAIPLLARILTVADAFDALASDRTYRKGHSRADALAKIEEMSGSSFDPAVVTALSRLLATSSRAATGPLTA